ncbi:hypothetical protein JTE90_005079 [Oedothorax gibbosus]|uniref:Senescence-associated protein n=1 Tax=Oedothorax gibbosus TaxID=931172 RepID=A0AAV6TF66_9ARAC|nr:hypothetical protein JTE90_005079 [Oedothorax gibbosus]
MIGRADIEGSKSNVAMNAWLPRASYPCGNSSDTSCIKLVKSKGSIGHAFAVRIHTENQDQASFCPFALREVSVLAELALGHLRYHLTDVEFTTRLRLHFQATRLQGDRIRIEPSSYGPRTHFGQQPRSRGLAAESVSGTLTPKRHISPRPCERGIRRWASPVHSPLLRESLLVSFPPLIYMLKFSGLSRLI